MSFSFFIFLLLAIRLFWDPKKNKQSKKKRPNSKRYDIEAPAPPPPSDWTAVVTKDGKITWDDGSMKSAWNRISNHTVDSEEHRPTRYARRTFPGGRVVIDARGLPGTNHTVRCKKLPGQLEPRIAERESEDKDTTGADTTYGYFIGHEPEMRVREMI